MSPTVYSVNDIQFQSVLVELLLSLKTTNREFMGWHHYMYSTRVSRNNTNNSNNPRPSIVKRMRTVVDDACTIH